MLVLKWPILFTVNMIQRKYVGIQFSKIMAESSGYHACAVALRTLGGSRPGLCLRALTLRTSVGDVHLNLLVNAPRRLLKRQLHHNLQWMTQEMNEWVNERVNEWKTLFTIFNLKRHLLVDMLEIPYWTNKPRDIYTNGFSRMITNFIGAKDLVSKLSSIHTQTKMKLFFFYLFLSLFTFARCEWTFTKKTQPSKSSALSLVASLFALVRREWPFTNLWRGSEAELWLGEVLEAAEASSARSAAHPAHVPEDVPEELLGVNVTVEMFKSWSAQNKQLRNYFYNLKL